jgi:hypothetical protein
MKQAVESQRAWELLLDFWNKRDDVSEENRCKKVISYPGDKEDEQCVLHKDHLDGEKLQANVPHADKDGNMVPLLVSWETIRAAENSLKEETE